ncbi:MAG: dolichyl-phosphate beta-D-mannosyltransferase [Anaerolineaceae bacterium 4572_5.2]|nr:MAG: dolichyl-phosphate beta-D-mannosyltransferase [Anaerolineaceae bacterium 4572_5.2]
MTISIIVPTYNESENIVDLTEMLLALPLDAQIIIVDDNSPDGTGQLADDLRAKHKRVHVIHRSGKLGLGTAYVAGFKKALRDGSELIVTMDADFSHHPKYIPAMVDLASDYHVTIGSRYVPGGGVENWEWYRKFLSWGANEFARAALGLKAHDCTAGFRCYRKEVLQSIDLNAIFSNGYSFLLEMAYKCQRLGCTFGETPIIFANRARGQSKISQTEIFKAMYTVLRLTASRLRFWRPKAQPIAPVKTQEI